MPKTPRETPLILIADDDSAIRALLTLALTEDGYNVEAAQNGEEGLAKYLRLQPDLVLLDAVMPEMDGFTCSQQIRSLPGGEQTPILMITFLDDRESIDQAFQSGATDYITKPIHWSVLRQRVKHLLASAHLFQQVEILRTQALLAPGSLGSESLNWEQQFRSLLSQVFALDQESPNRQGMLCQIATHLKTFFAVERVLIYPFHAAQSPVHGMETVEVVVPGYPSLQGVNLKDLQSFYSLTAKPGEAIVIDRLEQSELPRALREHWMDWQTPSMAIVPISNSPDHQPWGVLCLHRADGGRTWDPLTIDRLKDVTHLLSLILRA